MWRTPRYFEGGDLPGADEVRVLFFEPQLFELGGDDVLAIGGRLIIAVVVLVLFFRLVELLQLGDLCNDRGPKDPGLVCFADGEFSDLFLLLRVVEDG